MKKYKILFSILTFTVFFTACQKDFLNRTPMSGISDQDYWKSTNDLRLYVNNFYNGLPSYIRAYMNFGIYSEDDLQGSDNQVNYQYRTFLNGERTLPSSGGGWSYGDWSSIRSVNYFLGNYTKATGNQSDINKYVGEALFFKAYYYFDKLKTFGDLPWLSQALLPTDSTILFQPRLSRAVVVDSMMAILDQAIEFLPGKGESGYENFRVYKELAAIFQSRIALYEGTWEKYHAGTPYGVAGSNGSKFLQKAASAAQLVIDSKKFSLDNVGVSNGYWSLFNQTSYASSNEVMFWRQYNVDDGNYTFWAAYMRAGGGRGITRSLVNDYLSIDGLPTALSSLYQGDLTLVDIVKNRDPRLTQTIQVNDGLHLLNDTLAFKIPSYGAASEDNNYTGFQIYKGLNTNLQQQTIGFGTQGLIFFRYAEALLNLAEAKAELSTLTQADVDATINLLRDRVGMPHLTISSIPTDPNWIFPDLSPIINEVRRERRVEFGSEGYRHDDIWRWAAAGTLIKGWIPKGAKRQQFFDAVTKMINEDATIENSKKAVAIQAAIAKLEAQFPVDANDYISPYANSVIGVSGFNFRTDRDYLYPLPTNQLLLNTNLKQNPGWNQ